MCLHEKIFLKKRLNASAKNFEIVYRLEMFSLSLKTKTPGILVKGVNNNTKRTYKLQ